MRLGRAAAVIGMALAMVVAAACGAASSAPTVTPGGETPAPSTSAIVVTATAAAGSTGAAGTAVPATAVATVVVPAATVGTGGLPGATATARTVTSPQSVTLADDGSVIRLRVGDHLLLDLGMDTYTWHVTVSDQSVVSRVVNIAVVRGAQGVYEAHAAGRATLTAVGDPLCRSATPACGAPSRVFQVEIIVS
ncbi:MAG TPA: hypothetical protein VEZ14_07125 [Dehalococcoidia bacterium]|nr:hypothetical protein [Dehalococcoidia bacterium]